MIQIEQGKNCYDLASTKEHFFIVQAKENEAKQLGT